MANRLIHSLRRLSFFCKQSHSSLSRVVIRPSTWIGPPSCLSSSWESSWGFRTVSYGSVNVVLTEGMPKFEAHEVEAPKKEKWKTKKRLKLQRMREKRKRKLASKTDPRRLTIKGKKQKFPTAEARIKAKIEKALEKSKYEQSLESVRRFITISEKELELYYRHVALYGDPSCHDLGSRLILQKNCRGHQDVGYSDCKVIKSTNHGASTDLSAKETELEVDEATESSSGDDTFYDGLDEY